MMSEKVNTLIKVLVALEKAGAAEHDKDKVRDLIREVQSQ